MMKDRFFRLAAPFTTGLISQGGKGGFGDSLTYKSCKFLKTIIFFYSKKKLALPLKLT
jgi:hypothetical protein